MTVVSIVNVGNTFEPTGKSFAHLIFADEALSPGFMAPWKIKGAVIREEFHDRIEIMSIEASVV
jgi:hypothetical protein